MIQLELEEAQEFKEECLLMVETSLSEVTKQILQQILMHIPFFVIFHKIIPLLSFTSLNTSTVF